MALATRARFDGVPIWRQLAREYETAALELACFRGDLVPAARTEASVVDRAWGAADARYQTEDDVKAYASMMLEEAQRFYDGVHGGPEIVICVQDARDPHTRVYCRMNMCDKLQVAIDAYCKIKPRPSIQELEYGGVPFADKRVYQWNTPHALAMDKNDTILVHHEVVEQEAVVDLTMAKSVDICISGAEGLAEETFQEYVYCAHEPLDKYARDFCGRKGLDTSKVRFMHGGREIVHNKRKTIRRLVLFDGSSYIPKPEPFMIYVVPKPEFESDPDQCFVRSAYPDDQVHDGGAAGEGRALRRGRKVAKMKL